MFLGLIFYIYIPEARWLRCLPKEQKRCECIVSSNPTQEKTEWYLRFKKKDQIGLCTSRCESLCNRDFGYKLFLGILYEQNNETGLWSYQTYKTYNIELQYY